VTGDLVVAEDVASGPAVARALGTRSAVDALALRRAGDPRAVKVFAAASEALYAAIAAVTAIADVSVVAVSGGFGLAAIEYLVPSRRLPPQYWSVPVIHRDVVISAALTGADAPMIGLARSLCGRLGIRFRPSPDTDV
jgi:predicted NBD/HSP70 family sugar kinase